MRPYGSITPGIALRGLAKAVRYNVFRHAGRPTRFAQARKPEITNEYIAHLPGNHPQPAAILGGTRLPHHTALLHAGGRGHHEPGHVPARARPRAVERGVCGTLGAPR